MKTPTSASLSGIAGAPEGGGAQQQVWVPCLLFFVLLLAAGLLLSAWPVGGSRQLQTSGSHAPLKEHDSSILNLLLPLTIVINNVVANTTTTTLSYIHSDWEF